MSETLHTNTDPNATRLEIARALVERKRAELGPHLRAAAVYGSVAHGAAGAHSDVEVVLVTDETVPYGDDWYLEDGVMVEYTCVSAERMLAAARRVTSNWGVEADQYRHHTVLHDPDGYFPRLWEHASHIPVDAFAPAQRLNWWRTFELRGKFHNAVAAGDGARLHDTAWEFARYAALGIALHERRPYESGRTIWQDVAARGYSMRELLAALVAGEVARIAETLEVVWERVRAWEAPEGAP